MKLHVRICFSDYTGRLRIVPWIRTYWTILSFSSFNFLMWWMPTSPLDSWWVGERGLVWWVQISPPWEWRQGLYLVARNHGNGMPHENYSIEWQWNHCLENISLVYTWFLKVPLEIFVYARTYHVRPHCYWPRAPIYVHNVSWYSWLFPAEQLHPTIRLD